MFMSQRPLPPVAPMAPSSQLKREYSGCTTPRNIANPQIHKPSETPSPVRSYRTPLAHINLSPNNNINNHSNNSHDSISNDQLVCHRVVGRGSFGEVWEGTYRGIRVAVKRLHSTSITEKQVADFYREVSIMSKLNHPNVVKQYGYCPFPTCWIVTEFCSNGSLYDALHVRRQNFSWQVLIDFCRGIVSGLAYLHSHHPVLVHRDLKSHNVLLDSQNKTKIADFGLSKFLDNSHRLKTCCGTGLWMAPEVMRNEPYTEKADVYSCALVMFEIMTKQLPYSNLNDVQLGLEVAVHGRRPELPSSIDPTMKSIIVSCWSPSPYQRPSMREVLSILQRM